MGLVGLLGKDFSRCKFPKFIWCLYKDVYKYIWMDFISQFNYHPMGSMGVGQSPLVPLKKGKYSIQIVEQAKQLVLHWSEERHILWPKWKTVQQCEWLMFFLGFSNQPHLFWRDVHFLFIYYSIVFEVNVFKPKWQLLCFNVWVNGESIFSLWRSGCPPP